MSFFSSDRERRLWFWLFVVLVGIYATLGRAPIIAAALRERNDLRDTIFFILFVVMVVVAVLFINSRPGRAEIAVGFGILIIYVTAWLRIGTLEERTHLFEYGLVAALVHEALIEREKNGRLVPPPAVIALVISILLGWLDEGIQLILPNRVYDFRDVIFNTVAAVMVIGARWVLARVRRWAQARRRDG
ncbi:MAG: VanZ family protein [Chloroflexi bacterium]|nr:MAG: VanZ family protein [Chloroflexota bacterium]